MLGGPWVTWRWWVVWVAAQWKVWCNVEMALVVAVLVVVACGGHEGLGEKQLGFA